MQCTFLSKPKLMRKQDFLLKMPILCAYFLYLAISGSSGGLLGQSPLYQEFELRPAQKNAHSGWDVCLTEDWAFVSSPNFSLGDYEAAGKIDIYKRIGEEWHYQGELFSPEPTEHELFGFSIAAYGDQLVAGAVGNHRSDYMAGCLYCFILKGEKWEFAKQLIPEGITAGAELGFDVDMDDRYILAGAPFANGSFASSGAAYLFNNDSGEWSFQKSLVNKIDDTHTGFGTRVALGKDLLFVGTVYHNSDGTRTGKVLGFEKEGRSQKEIQVFAPETTSKCDCYGSSIAAQGDLLIIGARSGDSEIKDHGYVSCYKREGEHYVLLQRFNAPVKEKNGLFGISLALTGPYLIVGATGSEVNGIKEAGRVQVYRLENNKFVFERDIKGILVEKQGQFGSSLDVNRFGILVGSWGADRIEKDAGIAHFVSTSF